MFESAAALASFTSLVATLREFYSGRVNRREIGEEQSAFLAEGLARAVRFRDSGRLPAGQVYDLHFADFMRDPVRSIADIYRHFGRELTDEAAARMRRFLAANPGDKHGRHHYRFSETGLGADTERKRFASYRDRFGIEPESL